MMERFFTNKSILTILLFLFSVVFLVLVFVVSLTLEQSSAGTAGFITATAALALAILYFLFWREGYSDDIVTLTLAALPFFVLMLLRLTLFDYETLDYMNFLRPWGRYFKENGGFSALKTQIGNYNVPYMAFLALFSYIPVHDLYLIKLLSILFDCFLAYAIMKLISVYADSIRQQLSGFLVVFLLPTPLLNGALWGQCDSIYAAFAVFSLYLAIRGRPVFAVISIALSFAFKLQAIFVIPVFLIIMLSGKISFRHLLAFPITYVAAMLPAIIAGRPIWEALTVYLSEFGTVGSALNYNSPSIYSLFYNVQDTNLASKLGILAAASLCTLSFYLAVVRRHNLSGKAILYAALSLCVGIPMLLPHMHDRYFFIADVLIIVAVAVKPPLVPLAVLTSFASLLGYHAYLRGFYILPMHYGFIALCITFVVVFARYVLFLFAPPMNPVAEIVDDYGV